MKNSGLILDTPKRCFLFRCFVTVLVVVVGCVVFLCFFLHLGGFMVYFRVFGKVASVLKITFSSAIWGGFLGGVLFLFIWVWKV